MPSIPLLPAVLPSSLLKVLESLTWIPSMMLKLALFLVRVLRLENLWIPIPALFLIRILPDIVLLFDTITAIPAPALKEKLLFDILLPFEFPIAIPLLSSSLGLGLEALFSIILLLLLLINKI